jgi:4-alpha-glucanotransferase
MQPDPDKKLAGVLAPLFALRGSGDLGIGDTGALREMISWAARHRIGAIQILPVNETGGDHSPYNLRSAMALDLLTIETVPGALPGLTPEAFEKLLSKDPATTDGPVGYAQVGSLKHALLESAFGEFLRNPAGEDATRMARFEARHAGWLPDYALHRALVDWHQGSEDAEDWPPEHRNPSAARAWVEHLGDPEPFLRSMRFRVFVQWVAHEQWAAVRAHADSANVLLIGDVPVGVSRHSADVWCNPSLFDLTRTSGAPPEKVFQCDPFTAQWGQNWGFPLYDWQAMSRDNFLWWRRRLRLLTSIFHLLRVDHALGFFRIYSFPWRPEENARFTGLTEAEAAAITGGPLPRFIERDDATPENREFNRRHGEMIFRMFLEEVHPSHLLAEDLGEVAPYVRPTLERLGIPGFKIPQWERTGDRFSKGAGYPRASVTTFATHDHPPVRVLWEDLLEQTASDDPECSAAALRQMQCFMEFCGAGSLPLPGPFDAKVHRAFLRGLLNTNARLAIPMLPDIFGTTERFNIPGSAASLNWTCRMHGSIASWNESHRPILRFLRDAIRASGREPEPPGN